MSGELGVPAPRKRPSPAAARGGRKLTAGGDCRRSRSRHTRSCGRYICSLLPLRWTPERTGRTQSGYSRCTQCAGTFRLAPVGSSAHTGYYHSPTSPYPGQARLFSAVTRRITQRCRDVNRDACNGAFFVRVSKVGVELAGRAGHLSGVCWSPRSTARGCDHNCVLLGAPSGAAFFSMRTL